MSLPADFPAHAGAERDAAILAAVNDGEATYEWATIVTGYKDHTGSFNVFRDGLKLGGVRLAGSAQLCQQVADVLGACLPTPRILDEAWLQAAVQIPPATIYPNDNTTAMMVRHSAMIDAAVTAAGGTGLVMPVGKPWCLKKITPKGYAALYGWQSATPVPGVKDRQYVEDIRVRSPATPGVYVIQPFATPHFSTYVDYSSSIWLVSRTCVVDNVTRDLADVLKNAELAPLVSPEGILTNPRQV